MDLESYFNTRQSALFLSPLPTPMSLRISCLSLVLRRLSMKFQPVLFHNPENDDAIKVLHSVCQQIWKIQQWPSDWKRSVFILIPKKGNAKECSNYHTNCVISHASKVILKIHQDGLQQYVNQELPDVQAGFRKAEEPEVKLPTSIGS